MTKKVNTQRGQSQCFSDMEAWYSSPLGQQLLQAEQRILSPVLSRLFGYYLLQVGGSRGFDLVAGSPISHRVHMTPAQKFDFPGPSLHATLNGELPLASESIDVVVLPHTLEFVSQPLAVLSRFYAVLIPEGHLIVLGFNPYSLWGMARRLKIKQRHRAPWVGHFLSMYQVRKHLVSLGMAVAPAKTCFFKPPIVGSQGMENLMFYENFGQLCWPMCGATYMLVAKKLTQTLTPQRSRQWYKDRMPVKELVGTVETREQG